MDAVLDLPFIRTKPRDEEEDRADSEVGKDNTHPDLIGQWVHERKDARLLLIGFLDHNADSEVHEWLREIDDTLTHR